MTSRTPTTGFRAEFLEAIANYEQRHIRLAEARPAEKYTGRPVEGVRSVGEVFTHITAANYGIARALGTAPPAGIDFKAITGLSGGKPKVLQALKGSRIFAMPSPPATTPMPTSRKRCSTARPPCAVPSSCITGHFGEHLGQSIAYTRA